MTLIIAEAGVNHNGDQELAFELVKAAYEAGADIVKFQTFRAKNLVTKDAAQASYQVKNTGKKTSQLEMLARLELSIEAHHALLKQCNQLGIGFLSTAFDFESLDFLVSEIGLKTLKVPSGDITNAPLLLEHARTGCDLIVSTGMANLGEIEAALGIIAYGYTKRSESKPSPEEFLEAYNSESGKNLLRKKVTLLHCTSEYPAPIEDINLKAMDTLAAAFMLPVGYSDHSEGIAIPTAAAARGASLIEKHFTLDRSMEGPDHKASLEPDELRAMVKAVRQLELALGDGIKGPRPSELKNKSVARKSLVAAENIKAGDSFSPDNLTTKRPGHGLSPHKYWKILGTKAKRDYSPGELIIDL